MNVDEFIEICRNYKLNGEVGCLRRKTCHYEGCILDEKPKMPCGITCLKNSEECLKSMPCELFLHWRKEISLWMDVYGVGQS